MTDPLIPENYDEWQHCITVLCRQPLTEKYIDERITALTDTNDYMTQKFVELYGERQRLQTLDWFKQAKDSL